MTLVSLAPTRDAARTVAPPPPAMDRRRLLGVTLGHFLNDFHMSWLSPLLPLFVPRFHLSLALAGLLGTILNTSSALSQPLFGLAADRLSRSHLVALGPVLTVIAMSLTGVLPSYPATGGELAYALGPLYIAALVQWRGLSWTLLAGLPGIVAVLIFAALIWRWPTARPARAGTIRSALVAQRRMLILLWIYVMVRSIISISFITFLPLLLRERGLSLVMGGTAVFMFGGIGAAGGFTGGILAEWLGRRAVLVLSLLLSAPLMALYLLTPVGWGLILLPVAGVLLYTSAPVTVTMAQEGLPQHASLASSIVMGLAWGIGGLMLTVVGAVADAIGLQETLLLILGLGVVALLAAAGLSPARAPE